MAELSEQERLEATELLAKMIASSGDFEAEYAAWIEGNPDREAYFKRIRDGVHEAVVDADVTGLRPRWDVIMPPAAPAPSKAIPIRSVGRFRWRPVTALSVMILAVLALGTGVFLKQRVTPFDGGHPEIQFATRTGEVRPVKLSDGTRATLDTATEISVGTKDGVRTVELKRGRVRFEVAPGGSDAPFTVEEGPNRIVAQAGVFDVSYRGTLTAQVIDGAAEVRVRPAVLFLFGDRVLRLTPGQKLRFDSGQPTAPSPIAARPSDAQWVGGVKNLDDVPISEVIAEANTYSSIQIELEDPSLGDRTIFADLHIRDIEAVASAIANYLHLRIDRSQPGKLILTAKN